MPPIRKSESLRPTRIIRDCHLDGQRCIQYHTLLIASSEGVLLQTVALIGERHCIPKTRSIGADLTDRCHLQNRHVIHLIIYPSTSCLNLSRCCIWQLSLRWFGNSVIEWITMMSNSNSCKAQSSYLRRQLLIFTSMSNCVLQTPTKPQSVHTTSPFAKNMGSQTFLSFSHYSSRGITWS